MKRGGAYLRPPLERRLHHSEGLLHVPVSSAKESADACVITPLAEVGIQVLLVEAAVDVLEHSLLLGRDSGLNVPHTLTVDLHKDCLGLVGVVFAGNSSAKVPHPPKRRILVFRRDEKRRLSTVEEAGSYAC